MSQIKRFIDKITIIENKQGRDVILPLSDARALRDEIAKLLIDRQDEMLSTQNNDVIQVEMKGGKW